MWDNSVEVWRKKLCFIPSKYINLLDLVTGLLLLSFLLCIKISYRAEQRIRKSYTLITKMSVFSSQYPTFNQMLSFTNKTIYEQWYQTVLSLHNKLSETLQTLRQALRNECTPLQISFHSMSNAWKSEDSPWLGLR